MNDDKKLPDRMIEQDFEGVEIDNSGREGDPIDFTAPVQPVVNDASSPGDDGKILSRS